MEKAPKPSQEFQPDPPEVFNLAELLEDQAMGGPERISAFLAQVTTYLQATDKNQWRKQVELQESGSDPLIANVESRVAAALEAGFTPDDILIDASLKWDALQR